MISAAALAALGLSVAAPTLQQDLEPVESRRLVEQLRPVLVSIRRAAPKSAPGEGEYLATGLVISTNGHVLSSTKLEAQDSGKDALSVRFADGTAVPARVIGSDQRSSVTLLKVEVSGLAAAHLDLAPPSLGDPVFAVALDRDDELAIVPGVVRSLKARPSAEVAVPLMETTVGNMDGPIVNTHGAVIGLNAYWRRGEPDVALAVPIDVAMRVQAQLREYGRVIRGRLGIVFQELTAEIAAAKGLAEASGAMINSVEKGSPADRSGLRAGDILLEIGPDRVQTSLHAMQLIQELRPGVAVALHVWREGSFQTLSAVVGRLVDRPPAQ